MDAYIDTMDKVGDAIIKLIDPDGSFTGYTKVRIRPWRFCQVFWSALLACSLLGIHWYIMQGRPYKKLHYAGAIKW